MAHAPYGLGDTQRRFGGDVAGVADAPCGLGDTQRRFGGDVAGVADAPYGLGDTPRPLPKGGALWTPASPPRHCEELSNALTHHRRTQP